MNTNHINNDKILKDILQKSGIEEPSPDFTTNLMQMVSSISERPSVSYEPLIKKKVWAIMFAACLAVFAATILFPGKPVVTVDQASVYYNNLEQHFISPLIHGLIIIEKVVSSEVVLLSILSTFTLLALDYFARKRLKMK